MDLITARYLARTTWRIRRHVPPSVTCATISVRWHSARKSIAVTPDSPMHFRPGDVPQGDPDLGGPVDWEDNPLSNFMAWFSHKFLPRWCQTPEHWTSRITQHLFTDCPCCLLFRGLVIGGSIGILIGMMLMLAVLVVVAAFQ